jgi:hypothetical protein
VAEWLGSALQKLLQRFESARDLDKYKMRLPEKEAFLFSFECVASSACLSMRKKTKIAPFLTGKSQGRKGATFCILTLGMPNADHARRE